jgi:hypothetical protein
MEFEMKKIKVSQLEVNMIRDRIKKMQEGGGTRKKTCIFY